jgi:regulator of protease activity HflC (stomatin/prohibitin superfamily)
MHFIILVALAFIVGILIVRGFHSVSENERGVVIRSGRRIRSCGPGLVFITPLDKFECVSIEPFSVSIPPQSAITKDEIPIQLVASLDAVVKNPERATLSVRDWRIFLMSQLQEFMKERLEDLDFDNLEQIFPDWVQQIRTQLNMKAEEIGVEITGLQISNLSPRSKPS